MKKIILTLILITLGLRINCFSQERTLPEVNPNPATIDMARMLGKDVFEINGVPYLQPTVEVVNATSNSRFYNKAFVPSKVDKPYFKVGIHGMYGVVPEEKKTYSPQLPNEEFSEKNLEFDPITGKFKYGRIYYSILPTPKIDSVSISDPYGLFYTALRGMFYNGLKDGSLKTPQFAPTSLGHGKVSFELPPDTLKKLLQNLTIMGYKIYDYLPKEIQDSLTNMLKSFPAFFNLPEGGNLNYIFAMVPQIEIGSLYGTELLLRFIPPVDMGKIIGEFAFWGVGLKHSISQYFNEGDEPNQRYFDMAAQIVYQGTSLKNDIGVTNTKLEANATMLDFNIQVSKYFEDIIDVYSGFSYSFIEISSKYVYYIPIEIQWQLGLIDKYSYTEPNFKPTKPGDLPDTQYNHPGDSAPQTANVKLSDKAIKWNIGLSRDIGPVTIFVDYTLSKINMLTGGIVYNF